MKFAIASTVLFLATFGVAQAQSTDTKPKAEKKICRSQAPLGSLLAKSVCHTKAEWDAIDAVDQAKAQNSMSLRHQ